MNRKNRPFVTTFRRLCRNKMAVIGMCISIFLVLVAVFAPLLMPYPYDQSDFAATFAKPSSAHLFGTDDLGRDILSRLIYGARYSLQIGIISVAGAMVGGILLGSIAGYFGGWVDDVTMRFLDIIQAVPGMVLSIAVSAVLGPGFGNCILALTIGMIPSFSRMMRASILNVRKMEYLEAATSINCNHLRIILRHVLPNALSPLIVQATMSVATAILIAASLSFIGLGVQPPEPEWGAMLSAGRGYFRDYPHLVWFPGITIMVAVLSLNMFGDGLRDALDPKLKD
ncbi:MAG: ABC transporter permease [Lachnospiraceae bacterium]|nr:ABC transporter permease [Lachnospiraceae bacterium]